MVSVHMRLPLILAAGLLSATGVLTALPAHAVFNDCPDGSTCIWKDNNYTGTKDSRAPGHTNITPVSPALDNQMSSWANRSNIHDSCGYDSHDGGGDSQEWGFASEDNDVSFLNDNEVSSWRTMGGC
jgi:hypothetical protein